MSIEEQIKQAEQLLEDLKKKQDVEDTGRFNEGILKQKALLESLKGKVIENIEVLTSRYTLSDHLDITHITLTIDGVRYRFSGDPFYVQTNY